jgi:hypothetical protein
MLFDLRSRGRRTTVRVIYLFLAVVMVAGLVLVGVGTGSNQGGLLNAFTNGGSNGGQSAAANQQIHAAISAVKKNQHSAKAWSTLAGAYWSAASSNFDSSTGAYNAAGKTQLGLAAKAWKQYRTLAGTPSAQMADLGAEIYQGLGQWSNAAVAWQYVAQATPSSTDLKPYLCLAFASYAAKNKSNGDLAADRAVALSPKLQRLTLKSELKSARSSATTAQTSLLENC